MTWYTSRYADRNGAPPFYSLVEALKIESSHAMMQIKLLSVRKLKRRIRKQTATSNTKLFEI